MRPPNGHRSIEEPVGDEDTDADLARIMAADHCGGDVDDVTVM